jgi:single-stranded-DNA-specific exonuclease
MWFLLLRQESTLLEESNMGIMRLNCLPNLILNKHNNLPLKSNNTILDRKDLDKQITKEALQQIEENNEQERFTTVVFQEDWHKGVIGIVASRLIENYYRPTIVFTKSGDKYAASARSVVGFDVYNALEACSEHLEQFGGHMYAAGMTLKPENYQNLKMLLKK